MPLGNSGLKSALKKRVLGRRSLVAAAAMPIIALNRYAGADLLVWNTSVPSAFTSSNWLDQTTNQSVSPGAGDSLSIGNGGTVQWTGAQNQYIALSSTPVNSFPGGLTLDVSNGIFNISQGAGATAGYGLLMYSGSSFTVENSSSVNIAGQLSVAQDSTGSASVLFSGTSTISIGTGSAANLGIYDGDQGNGTVIQSVSATLNTPLFSLGFTAGASGTYQMQGGTLNISGAGVASAVGGDPGAVSGTAGGTGLFNISGGTVTISNTLEIFNTSSTAVNISGTGALSAGSLVQNGGSLNLSGSGSLTVGGSLNSSGGTISLAGGAITAGSLATAGNFNWTGGTLSVTNSSITIGSGGPLGSYVSLNSGKTLAVGYPVSPVSTNVTGTLNVSGGHLYTSSFNVGSGGSVNVTSGGIIAVQGFNIATGGSLVFTGGSAESGMVVQTGGSFTFNGTVYLNEGGLGGASFSHYTLGGGAVVAGSVVNGGSLGSFNWTAGMLNITGTGSSFGGALTVPSGGTLTLDGAITDPIVVSSGGVFNLDPGTGSGILNRTLNAVTLSGGSSPYAQMNVLPAVSRANRQLIVATGLSIAGTTNSWQGRVDLANNDLDVQHGSLATVTSQLQQGYRGGTWNGSGGIVSSSAASDSTHLTALGAIQNNQSGTALYTSFDGAAPGAGDLLVKYTYYGDANLDGKVDGSDYSRIDAGFLADKNNPNALTGWFNGDFNYDGVINGSDYTLIDNAFNQQGAQLSDSLAGSEVRPTAQLGAGSSVPEPSVASLLGAASIGYLNRRRRMAQ